MYIRGRGEEGNNSLYKEEEEREKEMKGCYLTDTFCCYYSYDNPNCPHEKCKCPSPTNGGIGCPPLNYYHPCEEHNSPPSPPSVFSNPPPSPPPITDNPTTNDKYHWPPPSPPTALSPNQQEANSAYSFIPNLLVVMVATMVVSFALILALVYYCTVGIRPYTYTSSFDDRNNRAQLRRRRARQSLQTSGSIRRSFFYAWPPSGFYARPRGLDESLICLIPIYTYEGSEESPIGSSTECVVCLGAFLPGDKLRLLPKCTHSFHVECIDEWLRSRTTCPLCRANVVNFNYANTAMAASASAQPSLNPNEPIPTSSSTCHQSLSTSTPHAPQSLPESTHPHKPVTELKRSFSDGLLPTKNASVARSAMSFDAASSASFAGTEFAKGKEVIKHGPNDPPITKNNMLSSIKRTLSDSRIFSFKRKNAAAAPTTSSHSHERPPI